MYETSIYSLIGFMFLCGVLGLYLVTYLFHASLPSCKSEARLDGKTALITGISWHRSHNFVLFVKEKGKSSVMENIKNRYIIQIINVLKKWLNVF